MVNLHLQRCLASLGRQVNISHFFNAIYRESVVLVLLVVVYQFFLCAVVVLGVLGPRIPVRHGFTRVVVDRCVELVDWLVNDVLN